MQHILLGGKIHRATVTQADLHVDAGNRIVGLGDDPAAPVPGAADQLGGALVRAVDRG